LGFKRFGYRCTAVCREITYARSRAVEMAERIRVWFDTEGDFLEVRFSEKAGFMRETKNEAVMERVDEQGNILGFSIMQVSRLSKGRPLVADLAPA
jgi:hypothetical protein